MGSTYTVNSRPSACRRHLQINLGIEQHLGQRLVIALGQGREGRMVAFPDAVQTSRVVELLQQRQDAHHGNRIRGHVGFLHLGGQIRARDSGTAPVTHTRPAACEVSGVLVQVVKLAHRLGRVLGFREPSRARATSERTWVRSGSETPSSWSYPQVLMAVSTVNRVLAGVQRNAALVLCQRKLCQQGKQDRTKRASKTEIQGKPPARMVRLRDVC